MRIDKGLVLLAGIAALSLAAVAPASAEFFSCHDKPGQLLYSYNGTPDSYRSRHNYSPTSSSYRAYGSTDYAAPTHNYRAGSSGATYDRYRTNR